MQGDVLVAYGSKHGATREIAEAIAEALRTEGLDARAESALTADPRDARAVVVGAALYTGKLHAHALHFLERYEDVLAELPLAVFGSGPRTLELEDVTAALRQLRSGLDAAVPRLRPVSLTIFGGAIDPHVLRWPFSRMQACDARDWEAVRAWATELAHRPDFLGAPLLR
jgi:menaquinone-dependent protoporphyrinogen oxidase